MFKNQDLRRYTQRYFIMVLLVGIVLFLGLYRGIGNVEQCYMEALSGLSGDAEILKERGYLEYHLLDYNAEIKTQFYRLYAVTYGIYLILAILGYILGIMLYFVPLRAVREAKRVSALVLDGRVEEMVSDVQEGGMDGDIGAFWEAYEKMVTAIAQSKDDEKKEKLFLQDLIADISHQLKTPLATLTIYQELLDNQELSDEMRKDMLTRMGDQLTRMEWLVLNLLKLARLEAGSIRFEPERQNLRQTLQLAIENVQMLKAAKGQKIRLQCDEGMELLHDREWTIEALTNILKNATEYAPEKSVIEVWAEQSSVLTQVHIKDYGTGISPDDIHKVFKRFYRAKSRVNENSIGIGLALSKSIINGQGGEIYVESVPGEYTCFTIAF